MLDFLTPRSIPGVELIEDTGYLRSISIEGVDGWVRVRNAPEAGGLIATVPAHLERFAGRITPRLRHLFDLDADPSVIARHFANDQLLSDWVRARPGLRIPGAWDGFELALRAVLGQQISVRGASTLAGRLAAAFGRPCESPDSHVDRLSPTAAALAAAPIDQIRAIGLPAARARTISELAKAVHAGVVNLDATRDPAAAIEKLAALWGFGPWTVQYIAMRALRWADAFPAGDLGLRKAAGGENPVSERALLERAQAWRPWRAYAAMYLWKSLGLAKPAANAIS